MQQRKEMIQEEQWYKILCVGRKNTFKEFFVMLQQIPNCVLSGCNDNIQKYWTKMMYVKADRVAQKVTWWEGQQKRWSPPDCDDTLSDILLHADHKAGDIIQLQNLLNEI